MAIAPPMVTVVPGEKPMPSIMSLAPPMAGPCARRVLGVFAMQETWRKTWIGALAPERRRHSRTAVLARVKGTAEMPLTRPALRWSASNYGGVRGRVVGAHSQLSHRNSPTRLGEEPS